jgi:DNA segregation ATPase FtsK/SpoIIIE, S-DNA-T family
MGRDPYRHYYRRYNRRAARRALRRMPPGYPFLLPWQEESLGVLIAIGLTRWVYRHRSALIPLWVALGAFVAAAWVHSRHPGWWIPITVGTVIVTAVLGFPYGLLRRYRAGRIIAVTLTRIWRACGIDRPAELVYLAVVAAVTGGWLAAAAGYGPLIRPLRLTALFAMVILGIPWWVHRGRRNKVRIERTMDNWPDHAENAGLPGSRIVSAVVDTWGWTGHLALQKGTTAAQAIEKIPAIESVLGVPPGTVRVTPDNTRADRAVMRVIETNPHANPIPWPGPVITSITQLATLGLFEDGRPVQISLLRRNILVGGTTGAGKSGVLNVLLAILTACNDVVIWAVDLKGGMELGAWAACLGRPLATSPEQAAELFADAVRLVDGRAAEQAAKGSRLWQPTPDDPAVIIIVDEYAEMPPAAQEYADSVSRRGRAVAVNLLIATQRPTQEAMGHNAVRSQIDIRICLRVREPRDTDLILGQGSLTSGWRAHAITQPGVFLISSPQHTIPERALAYWLDDGQVRRHVSQHAHGRPQLPPAGSPGAAQSPQTARGGQEPTEMPPDPDAALWDALSAAGEQGAPVAALLQVTGMTRPTLYRRLRALARAGRAVQTVRGRWRAVTPPNGDG